MHSTSSSMVATVLGYRLFLLSEVKGPNILPIQLLRRPSTLLTPRRAMGAPTTRAPWAPLQKFFTWNFQVKNFF